MHLLVFVESFWLQASADKLLCCLFDSFPFFYCHFPLIQLLANIYLREKIAMAEGEEQGEGKNAGVLRWTGLLLPQLIIRTFLGTFKKYQCMCLWNSLGVGIYINLPCWFN